MTSAKYTTPQRFKNAVESKLKNTGASGALIVRKRQLLVFGRIIARVGAVFGESATLKGGLALERRIERARATKDVDLRMSGKPADVDAELRK